MEIGVPYQLSNTEVSLETIIDVPETADWPSKSTDMRSNRYQTHEHTRSLVYRWAERSEWPILNVSDNRGLYKHQEILDIAYCINTIFNLAYDPLNIILAELPPHSEIHEHFDAHPFFSWARRFHLPIKVPASCVFTVDGFEVPVIKGRPFEISNTRVHKVVNNSDENRYHLIMDFPP